MVISKHDLIEQFKGILIAVATWMIVIPFRDWILETSPLKNSWMVGVILLIIVLFWKNR